jgi:hypothetical protein
MADDQRRRDDFIMTFSDDFYDEYTLLEACLEYDFEAIQNILDDSPTDEELNERDQTGKVCYKISMIIYYLIHNAEIYFECNSKCVSFLLLIYFLID